MSGHSHCLSCVTGAVSRRPLCVQGPNCEYGPVPLTTTITKPKENILNTPVVTAPVRKFSTGATRDIDTSKPDYEGFLSPLVLEAYGAYMAKNRRMKDGTLRASDNWQLGIPADAYMKSGWRHFFDWWKEHRGIPTKDGMVTACLALLFNVSGYLHEYLKKHPQEPAS